MDRSQSILKSLVAAALLTGGLLSAGAALAQRAITNSNSGNGGGAYTSALSNTLVQCSIFNTQGLVAGEADACSRQDLVGETIAAVEALADVYSDTRSYNLAWSGVSPDTLQIDDSDLTSSGGLFKTNSNLGGGGAVLFFLQPRVGSFVLATSGSYANDSTNGESRAWSAYYLFDNVTFASVEGENGFALMPVELFELDGSTRTFTNGLKINQVSVYDLQRVPEAGSLALAGLALAVLVLVRRRRHGPTA